MLQKYFPIMGEINSPLAACAALGFSATAAKIAISGVSNDTLESLLVESIASTETYKKEVEVSASQLAAARVAAKKELKAARYRAAMAARSARRTSKMANRVKAVRIAGAPLRGLVGFSLENCRSRAATAQAAVYVATTVYNAALEAVDTAVNKGGDTRAIRSSVAALKAAVCTLEVRHVELRFAREMLAIALVRHSA